MSDYVKWPQLEVAFDYAPNRRGKGRTPLTIYEFGVCTGDSILQMLNIASKRSIPIEHIYGLDSFEGLPEEDEDVEKNLLYEFGAYNSQDKLHVDTAEEAVNKLRDKINDDRVKLIKCWYDELSSQHIKQYNLAKADIIHIDSDLYISAKAALNFILSNNLYHPSYTVLAYDEFYSVDDPEQGGESKAHYEICEEFNLSPREVWFNEYTDRHTGVTIRQGVFKL